MAQNNSKLFEQSKVTGTTNIYTHLGSRRNSTDQDDRAKSLGENLPRGTLVNFRSKLVKAFDYLNKTELP